VDYRLRGGKKRTPLGDSATSRLKYANRGKCLNHGAARPTKKQEKRIQQSFGIGKDSRKRQTRDKTKKRKRGVIFERSGTLLHKASKKPLLKTGKSDTGRYSFVPEGSQQK